MYEFGPGGTPQFAHYVLDPAELEDIALSEHVAIGFREAAVATH